MSQSLHQQIINNIQTNKENHGLIYTLCGHFYYTKALVSDKLYTLTLPTRQKKEGVTAMVGDIIEFNPKDNTITKVLDRRSNLYRPKVANVDRAIILVSTTYPEADLDNLNKLLAHTSLSLPVKPVICLSKVDEYTGDFSEYNIYKELGYDVIGISNFTREGISELLPFLDNYTSVVAGKSGVGKSSLLNILCADLTLETKSLSPKTKSGTHTTRQTTLYTIQEEKYKFNILDTPGFSNLQARYMPEELLKEGVFPEINNNNCEYTDCRHLGEEGCVIEFTPNRYKSYCAMQEEAADWERNAKESQKLQEEQIENLNKIVSNKVIPKLNMRYRKSSRKSDKQEGF